MSAAQSPAPPARAGRRERAPIDRRNDAIAAGIEVLAQLGARGLTHRQVARQLGWPLGSTSNYFRRRIDIFVAIAARIMELDLADLAIFDADLNKPGGIDADMLVEHMVHLIAHSTAAAQRSRSLARVEILLEAARNDQVREAVALQIGIADGLFRRVFEQLDVADPLAAATLFSSMVSSTYLGLSVAHQQLDAGQLETIVRSWVAVSIAPPAGALSA